MNLVQAWIEAAFPPRCAGCGLLGRGPFCVLCGDALETAGPFEIRGASGARAAFRFGGPIVTAVHSMKYGSRAAIARSLGPYLAKLLEELDPIEGLIPVPLGRKRLIERGFNQALELARGVGPKVYTDALLRISETPPQTALSRAAREANLAGAFLGRSKRVEGRSLALIDDVVTTGATARAATRALLAAGARSVVVVALAHADTASFSTVEGRAKAK